MNETEPAPKHLISQLHLISTAIFRNHALQ